MAEFATIARPYAEALFAASGKQATAAQDWLDALAQVAQTPELLAYATGPDARADQVFDLIGAALPKPLPEHGSNFLRTVIDNGRLAALPEVSRQFRALVNAQTGRSDALIQSAFPIEGKALDELKTVLEKRFKRDLTLHVEVDPDLIGGIRAVVDDEVLDLSVQARLQQMKSALMA